MEFGNVLSQDEIWRKLTELAASGDCRAMKLYYELLEKKQKTDAAHAPDLMQMAAIRRAVFGNDVVAADLAAVDGGSTGVEDDKEAD